jgi:hypothetical protein
MAMIYLTIHLLFANLCIWRFLGFSYNITDVIEKRDILMCLLTSWLGFLVFTFFYFTEKHDTRFFKFSLKVEK